MTASVIQRSQFQGFDIAVPGANTGITGGVQAILGRGAMRIWISVETASVVNVTITDLTPTTKTIGLNMSVALQASDLYVFDTPSFANFTYDVEVETNGVIALLKMEEIARV